MRELFNRLNKLLKNGESAVLVTIVASSGSTPRGAGARMLVTSEGRLYGTIGGGAVEYHSEQMALEVLRTKNSHMEHYRLHENQIQDLGMICGGDANIYFRYIDREDNDVLELTEKIETLYEQSDQAWLISEITTGEIGEMNIYSMRTGIVNPHIPEALLEKLGNKPMQLKYENRLFYCEKLVRPGKVYIFGGGHVSQALVPILASVDFNCVVLEDRNEFCNPKLFSGLAETRLINNNNLSDYVEITDDDFVVIMTRGHKDDQNVQAQILRTPATYIGVIGSRRKSAKVFENLRKLGFTDSDLERITTPIGLDIKAETPAEIAVSVAAQMILVRAENLK